MRYDSVQVGAMVRQVRRRYKITQKDLALTSDTGLRFIIDLEKGKPTCHLGKVLAVLSTLGIGVHFDIPGDDKGQGQA